jgi:hypothetical protein
MAENARASPTCNPRDYRFESWPRPKIIRSLKEKIEINRIPDSL